MNNQEFLNKLREVTNQNYQNERFNVTGMAKAMKMSRKNLHRRVSFLEDQSPVEYLQNYRLEKAKHLLLDDAYNISEVAWDCGFSNGNYFARLFRRKEGCSPGEWRKKQSEN